MRFIRNFVICLIVAEIFFAFGGGLLFDLRSHYYLTAAVLAFIAAVLVSVYAEQERRIEELEKRISALENPQPEEENAES